MILKINDYILNGFPCTERHQCQQEEISERFFAFLVAFDCYPPMEVPYNEGKLPILVVRNEGEVWRMEGTPLGKLNSHGY